MAMRGKQQPNNTSAWRALGPFNLGEIVAHGGLRGYLSRHWTIQGNRSLLIGQLGCYETRLRVLPCECQLKCVCVCERGESGVNKPTCWWCLFITVNIVWPSSLTQMYKDRRLYKADKSAYVVVQLVYVRLLACTHVLSRSEHAIRGTSRIRKVRVSVGIRFSEVSGLPSSIFYSILLFRVREKPGIGGRRGKRRRGGIWFIPHATWWICSGWLNYLWAS